MKTDDYPFFDLELDSNEPDTFQPVEISGDKAIRPVMRVDNSGKILDAGSEAALSIIERNNSKQRLGELHISLGEAMLEGDSRRIQAFEAEIAKVREKISQTYPETAAEVLALAKHNIKPREWLLEGAIPRGYTATIFGAGGIGKSLLSLYLAILACIGGQRFMGLTFPSKAVNVLYLDFELEADEQTRRAQQITRGLDLQDVPGNLFYASPGESLSRYFPKLKGVIQTHSIELVVIDSFGASGTDGESVQDVVSLFTELKRLGVTILLLDHQSKMQAKDDYNQKTPFGSVYKENFSRSVFQLSREEAHDNRMTLRLRHTKTNFGKFQDDLIFDMSFEGDRVLFTQSQAQPPEAKEMGLIENAINALEADGKRVNQKAIFEQCKGSIGKERVRSLLEKGEGERWDSQPGDRREKVYKSKSPKNESLSNPTFGLLEYEQEVNEVPNEFFDENPN